MQLRVRKDRLGLDNLKSMDAKHLHYVHRFAKPLNARPARAWPFLCRSVFVVFFALLRLILWISAVSSSPASSAPKVLRVDKACWVAGLDLEQNATAERLAWPLMSFAAGTVFLSPQQRG